MALVAQRRKDDHILHKLGAISEEISGDEAKEKEMSDFEEVWTQLSRVTDGADPKDIAELFWRKGVCDGKESVLKEIRPLVANITPEEAMKVESVTIGERIDLHHLADVIEAKKHIN